MGYMLATIASSANIQLAAYLRSYLLNWLAIHAFVVICDIPVCGHIPTYLEVRILPASVSLHRRGGEKQSSELVHGVIGACECPRPQCGVRLRICNTYHSFYFWNSHC